MKLPVVRWCLFVGATVGLAASAGAIPPQQELEQLVVRRWTVFDGLPQSSVNAILQREDGALWLATFGGLVKFDGLTFTPVPVIGPQGNPVPRILSLYEDRRGTLWIGTEGAGLARLEGTPRPRAFGAEVSRAPRSARWRRVRTGGCGSRP